MNMHATVGNDTVKDRINTLREQGLSDELIIDQLEEEGYKVVRDGLYGHIGIKVGHTTTYY